MAQELPTTETREKPNKPRERHFFAPDIPQNSGLDGGLAVLKCVLDGYNFPVLPRQLFGALRIGMEITSLGRIAGVANKFGLDAALTLTPIDHLLMPLANNLPAIVIGRQLTSNPNPRFLVIWRKHGPSHQVMEPGIGLRWVSTHTLLDELGIVSHPIAAHAWREQIAANGFVDGLRQRLVNLKLGTERATQLVNAALQDATWRSLAILDAATRAVDVGVRAGGWSSGENAGKLIEHFCVQMPRDFSQADWISQTNIPQDYWSVVPQADSNDQLVMRGVEFIRINPLQTVPPPQPANAQGMSPMPFGNAQGGLPGQRANMPGMPPMPFGNAQGGLPGQRANMPGMPPMPFGNAQGGLPGQRANMPGMPPQQPGNAQGGLPGQRANMPGMPPQQPGNAQGMPPMPFGNAQGGLPGQRANMPGMPPQQPGNAQGIPPGQFANMQGMPGMPPGQQAKSPNGKKASPWQIELEMWKAVRADGVVTPAILGIGLALSTTAVAIEALFLRSMIQIGEGLDSTLRIGVISVLLIFFVTLALLRMPINSTVMRLGRRLETRMRIALLAKIPRLSSSYFLDRPAADLNRRAYALRELREAPELFTVFLQAWFQLLVTAVCICLLEPTSILWVALNIITGLLLTRLVDPLVGMPIYRCFMHTNTLNLFYLDSLLGLVPARTHSAERAIRREHAGALLDLMQADVQQTIRFAIFFLLVSITPAVWTIGIVFNYVERGGTAENMLLLIYWTLNIPILLEQASSALIQYMQRCRPAAVSLAQVLEAPEETSQQAKPIAPVSSNAPVSIKMNNVGVQVGNSTLLANVNLDIQPGEHVAVVGSSGAGKSSMVGLLLGWHRPTTGELLIDNEPLEGERLYALRQATAWIDTGVQLWNRSLLYNLQYGARRSSATPIAPIVRDADLFNVLTTLPNGLQTLLGENGRLVSGGEGQRVRLGRVLFRTGVRLAILDEPFRALDRPSRRKLLAQARTHWKDATLILISHDVADVQNFERVLVMEHGHIVEDGVPSQLAAQPGSRYRALLDAEQLAQQVLWGSATWRRLWLSNGQLSDAERGNGHI
jgi:ABC-type bacteriocin/lantibiotic exporter with double-glycine peptidase domain